MDNIEEIAQVLLLPLFLILTNIFQLGLRFDVPVHVDAIIGGFILPFLEQCDYPAPGFDFRISGVSSICVDLHKVIFNYYSYKNFNFLVWQQSNWVKCCALPRFGVVALPKFIKCKLDWWYLYITYTWWLTLRANDCTHLGFFVVSRPFHFCGKNATSVRHSADVEEAS